MTHTPHELPEEFPEHIEKIHELKVRDAHFARLAEEYHNINRQIHRSEAQVEPLSDEHEEELRKRRLRMKDEIAAILAKS
ncbi:MAG: DUF465 domain-containing protein [Parvularculaceae bacterium]